MKRTLSAQVGATTIELVGLATAVGVLLTAAAVAMSSSGHLVGASTGRELTQIISASGSSGDAGTGRTARRRSQLRQSSLIVDAKATGSRVDGAGATRPGLGPAMLGTPTAASRVAVAGGDSSGGPSAVAGLSNWVWKSGGRNIPGGSISWCAGCAGASFVARPVFGADGSADAASFGSERRSTELAAGPGIRVDAEAGLALAAAQMRSGFSRSTGWGSGTLDASANALVGARASAYADGRFSKQAQSVDAGVDALAGASVRAQEKGSLTILGVTLSQSAGAEGWAGAGVRGRAQAERAGGKLTLGAAGGAAWGLGGAADVQVTVDATKLLTHPAEALAPLLRLTGEPRHTRQGPSQ